MAKKYLRKYSTLVYGPTSATNKSLDAQRGLQRRGFLRPLEGMVMEVPLFHGIHCV
jgi:hypothetical protein